jgi:germination protein M
MKQYRWTRWAAVTGIVMLLTSGCSILGSKEQSQPIDPPQTGAADAAATSAKPVSGAVIQNPSSITVYAKDSNGLVAPVGITVEKSIEPAKQALEAMVENNPSAAALPSGFTALIPQGTTVKGINVVKDQKLAIVDFSKAFTDYNVQDERKILEGIADQLSFGREGAAARRGQGAQGNAAGRHAA